MRVEIPQVGRCCFCFPLRRGLLFWTYIKLVAAIFLTFVTVASLIQFSKRQYPIIYEVTGSIALLVLLLEIVFNILFLISAHRKNHVYLTIYYRYAVGMFILQGLFMLGYVGFEIYVLIDIPYVLYFIQFMVVTTCFTFGVVVMQLYFIVLVRSEIRKLKNGSKFEFVNHTSEAVCKAQIM